MRHILYDGTSRQSFGGQTIEGVDTLWMILTCESFEIFKVGYLNTSIIETDDETKKES